MNNLKTRDSASRELPAAPVNEKWQILTHTTSLADCRKSVHGSDNEKAMYTWAEWKNIQRKQCGYHDRAFSCIFILLLFVLYRKQLSCSNSQPQVRVANLLITGVVCCRLWTFSGSPYPSLSAPCPCLSQRRFPSLRSFLFPQIYLWVWGALWAA